MDIVLPLTHWKGCLQTIKQFISPRVGTFFLSSHYFSSLSLSIFISQALALPSPLHHPLSHSLLPSLSVFLSQTCLFPVCNLQHTNPWAQMHARSRDKKVMIQARLCWQSSLPSHRTQSIRFSFCSQRRDEGYGNFSGLFSLKLMHSSDGCIGEPGWISIS